MATTTYKILGQQPAVTKVQTRAFISNKALTSNLATLTTNAAHGISQVGTIVTVQGVDATFDGTYVIHSIASSTSFTYVKTTANVTSAAVSPVGIATFTPVTSGFTISNKVTQNFVATLTTGSAHGITAGEWVAVTIGDTIYDTQQAQVIAVPTTTTFSYVVATQTAASTAVTQGAEGRTSFSADLDTVPASTQAVASTLYVANQTNSTQYYRIALRIAGAALANQYIAYDVPLPADSTTTWTTGISAGATDVITVQASSNLVSFNLTGAEIA
jgi:hypothetical protein